MPVLYLDEKGQLLYDNDDDPPDASAAAFADNVWNNAPETKNELSKYQLAHLTRTDTQFAYAQLKINNAAVYNEIRNLPSSESKMTLLYFMKNWTKKAQANVGELNLSTHEIKTELDKTLAFITTSIKKRIFRFLTAADDPHGNAFIDFLVFVTQITTPLIFAVPLRPSLKAAMMANGIVDCVADYARVLAVKKKRDKEVKTITQQLKAYHKDQTVKGKIAKNEDPKMLAGSDLLQKMISGLLGTPWIFRYWSECFVRVPLPGDPTYVSSGLANIYAAATLFNFFSELYKGLNPPNCRQFLINVAQRMKQWDNFRIRKVKWYYKLDAKDPNFDPEIGSHVDADASLRVATHVVNKYPSFAIDDANPNETDANPNETDTSFSEVDPFTGAATGAALATTTPVVTGAAVATTPAVTAAVAAPTTTVTEVAKPPTAPLHKVPASPPPAAADEWVVADEDDANDGKAGDGKAGDAKAGDVKAAEGGGGGGGGDDDGNDDDGSGDDPNKLKAQLKKLLRKKARLRDDLTKMVATNKEEGMKFFQNIDAWIRLEFIGKDLQRMTQYDDFKDAEIKRMQDLLVRAVN